MIEEQANKLANVWLELMSDDYRVSSKARDEFHEIQMTSQGLPEWSAIYDRANQIFHGTN